MQVLQDALLPFVFESLSVRGALIQLRGSWRDMCAAHTYPAPVAAVLGQAAAAAGLIANSLKFEGSMTLQISGAGPMGMLVMQCTDQLDLRGMARHEPTVPADFRQLVGDARCAITLNAAKQERPYQGIVAVNGDSLTACLEDYFVRSVQVPSHLQLIADGDVAGGILLQQMPGNDGTIDADDWNRLGFLAGTLGTADILPGIGMDLLRKLFSEDDLRVFAARQLQFQCRCSRERVEDMLKMLGEAEVISVLEERGDVEVTCEYCGTRRHLDAVDVRRLFAGRAAPGTQTVH
jgi:molecular chaperone Hsp33